MNRGISFESPNEYGTILGEVLKPIDTTIFKWRIGNGESYIVVDDELDEALFSEDKKAIEGTELKKLLENNKYYIVFADLQAYPKGEFFEIETYENFIESKCELVLLVVDSCYFTIYCRNKETIELLYKNATDCGFEDIKYITDENDTRTRLSAW
ncbi:DUF2691 family protein [Peribacillus psychrosaccharolyticus]|uniref:DUF2691 family protein n=1 Tax=Peribacillus psychrosaccharolyticus TaxID=1407 RepID=UPI003D27B7B5